ncbi:hypothetical protein HDU93_001954 [Gonapodya sp. JEL0774]|nr:hypothetical protein HDU93_001954 [Gonapodya sp. JEL0774]
MAAMTAVDPDSQDAQDHSIPITNLPLDHSDSSDLYRLRTQLSSLSRSSSSRESHLERQLASAQLKRDLYLNILDTLVDSHGSLGHKPVVPGTSVAGIVGGGSGTSVHDTTRVHSASIIARFSIPPALLVTVHLHGLHYERTSFTVPRDTNAQALVAAYVYREGGPLPPTIKLNDVVDADERECEMFVAEV